MMEGTVGNRYKGKGNTGGGWTIPEKAKPAEYESCPYVVRDVLFTIEAYEQVKALMHHVKGTEWLAYLDGHYDTYERPVVMGLRVPPQQVTGSTVDVLQWVPSPTHLGVMHSHGHLACDFSGTDHDYINANHRLSVLARLDPKANIEMTCEYKETVACGITMRTSPRVLVMEQQVPGMDNWLEGALGNIQKRPVQVVHVGTTVKSTTGRQPQDGEVRYFGSTAYVRDAENGWWTPLEDMEAEYMRGTGPTS